MGWLPQFWLDDTYKKIVCKLMRVLHKKMLQIRQTGVTITL
jgi:plasmid maintenance system killer protein